MTSRQVKLRSNAFCSTFLIAAGLKPRSIVSYNHLGNNDGKNLSEAEQFRSKEISKSGVLDDFLKSNPLLFKRDPNNLDEVHPKDQVDHTIVIKYIPHVGDSKRAMDEYTSEILLGGTNTLVLHNTCEDSLLAVPVMIDLVLFSELLSRIQIAQITAEEQQTLVRTTKPKVSKVETLNGSDVTLTNGHGEHDDVTVSDEVILSNTSALHFGGLETLLASTIGYFLKAPCVDGRVPLVNSLFRQRASLENLLRACVGLTPIDHMFLDRKLAPATSTTFTPNVISEALPTAAALKIANGNANGHPATNGVKLNGMRLNGGSNGHAVDITNGHAQHN